MQRKPQHLGYSVLIAIALSSLGLGGCYPLLPSEPYSYKVRSSEVKQTIGSMNRAQQAYFLETNHFSKSVAGLQIGIPETTKNYQYSIRVTPKAAFQYGIVHNDLYTRYIGPIPYTTKGNYYGVVGGVFLVPSKNSKPSPSLENMESITILCKATTPGKEYPAKPVLANGQPKCAAGTEPLP